MLRIGLAKKLKLCLLIIIESLAHVQDSAAASFSRGIPQDIYSILSKKILQFIVITCLFKNPLVEEVHIFNTAR